MLNHPDILIIAPPESRRVRAFQTSLGNHGLPKARVLPWTEFLKNQSLEDLVKAGTIVRIESPGEDWETEKALLELGDVEDADGDFERMSACEARKLEFDFGCLQLSRQWWLGFRVALEQVKTALEICKPHVLMNHPDEISLMFDKVATHKRLSDAGISVPEALTGISSFDVLFEQMQAKNWRRVFVKLAHGSSASGAIALETNGTHWQATSTVAMVQDGQSLKLYNSKKLLKYTTLLEIQELVNAVCQQRVHVERWIPKASFESRTFDLRVVVIAGVPQQVIVRSSLSPITNLHLGNERGDWNRVLERLGAEHWASIRQTCKNTLECFPKSLYAGVDVLVTTNFAKHAILEVNAFGDYHRNVLVNGLDTYSSELKALGVNLGVLA